MPKKRLTREESRESTRRRLLEAAASVIARVGFASAAVEEIAETAGFSRGAFYSNFESKDDLFLAVLRKSCDTKMAKIAEIFTEGGTPEALMERLRVFYASLYKDDDFLLWSEAKMHATRADRFREGVNDLDRHTRAQLSAYVGRYYEETGTTPPAPPGQIALALMALADGMAMVQVLDPSAVPDEVAESVMRLVFTSIT